MSTKIYNGLKFKENFSLLQLNNILKDLREKFQELANQTYANIVTYDFMFLYDTFTLKGKEAMLQEYKNLTGEDIDFDETNPDWRNLYFRLSWEYFYIIQDIEDGRQYNERLDLFSSMQILPIEGKTLATFYPAKPIFWDIIHKSIWIEEYIYQNQTDQPEEISYEEWEQRKLDWEEAIPTGIPKDSGVTVEFVSSHHLPIFDAEILRYKLNISKKEQRARRLAYEEEVPNEIVSLRKMFIYTEEYKKFIQEKTSEIEKKLKDVNELSDIFDTAINQ